LVFYPPSPRCVDVETAQRIVAVLPPFISVVGLFVNPEPVAVRAVLESVRLDLLQFHGSEEPADCEFFGKPYLKAENPRYPNLIPAQELAWISTDHL